MALKGAEFRLEILVTVLELLNLAVVIQDHQA
jgi:hypothetical protein